MARKAKEFCHFLVWRIPKDLKKKFKLKCMQEDITMREQIVKMMKGFLEKRS